MLEDDVDGRPPPRGRPALSSLRHRNFRLIWAGQIGRGLAWWLQAVVLAPWILQIGGGPIDLGIVAALQFGPVLILAPLGGVMADSLPRARVLPVLQLVMATISVAFLTMAVTGHGAMTWIFLLSLLFGLANAVEMPVRQSFIAEIVPRDDLMNAIGLNQLAFNLTRVIGPALGGVLVVTIGLAAAFAAAAAASVTVAILTSRVDVDESARPAWRLALRTVAPALAAGGRHALTRPLVLWPLALLGLVGIAGGGFLTLLPVFAIERLGVGEEGYGALLAIMGVGAMLGAIPNTTAQEGAARRRMTHAAIGLGLCLILLALAESLAMAVVLTAIWGFLNVAMNGSINQTIQTAVQDDLRGRIMGQHTAVFHGGPAIGGFLAGIATSALGIVVTMVIGGGLAIAAAVWVLLLLRKEPEVMPTSEHPLTRP